MAFKRARWIKQPFKLKTRNNIRMFTVPVFGQSLIRHPTKARGHDNCSYLEIPFLSFLGEINGITATYRYTDFTGIMLELKTGVRINKITGRHRLGIINMNGPGNGKPFVIVINQMAGTVFGAEPTCCTVLSYNITGTQTKFCLELTGFTVECKKISVSQNFNIGRPTGLN